MLTLIIPARRLHLQSSWTNNDVHKRNVRLNVHKHLLSQRIIDHWNELDLAQRHRVCTIIQEQAGHILE